MAPIPDHQGDMPGIVDISREAPMRPRTPSDEAISGQELVDRARAGEAEAWSEIVRTLGPRVRGYARGKGIVDDDDVMQDVFLAAAERIGEFQGDWRSFRSWIFSIAYRQIVNRYRANPSRGHVGLTDPPPASPDEEVLDRDTVSAAMVALDTLTDVERDVVLLRVIAGLDTDEVADAVGRKRGNIRVIQSRALAKVRSELARQGFADDRSES